MSKSNVQPSTDNKMLDAVVVTLAILIAVAGVLAFTFLSDESLGVRFAALFGAPGGLLGMYVFLLAHRQELHRLLPFFLRRTAPRGVADP